MSCKSFNKYKRTNIKEPLLVHEFTKYPYIRLGVDFVKIAGHTYLLVIDYYSKWFKSLKLYSKSADTVIKEFKILFSRFGIPFILC